MIRDERALAAVPWWLWAILLVAFITQLVWHAQHGRLSNLDRTLPPPPSVYAVRLAGFGEREAASRIVMLYVQSFDAGGASRVPLRSLDYSRVLGWLKLALQLDPRSGYPLFAAARVYGEVSDAERCRMALEFVYTEFLRDPDRRWPWLAHAALLAKHRLHDLQLALRFASAIDRYTTAPDVPSWAKQMRIFILEDMNELDAAKILLGGLLESGRISDPAEARFLADHLKRLEKASQEHD